MKKFDLGRVACLSLIAIGALLHVGRAYASDELGYLLTCETKTKRFTIEIADKDLTTGSAELKIYDRVGKYGTRLRATTSVKINIEWRDWLGERYISGFNYEVSSVIQVDLRRVGLCDDELASGTSYRGRINSNQPMLEFKKNTRVNCKNMRVYVNMTPAGGGTSM